MKTTTKLLLAASLMAAVLSAQAGVQVGVQIGIPAPPRVYIERPVRVAVVPQFYVWDGSEYVGAYNGDYYYLAGGGFWLPLDQNFSRHDRFHDWQGHHPDWRSHAIRSDYNYHRHSEPVRYYRDNDQRGMDRTDRDQRDRDQRDRDHDRDHDRK